MTNRQVALLVAGWTRAVNETDTQIEARAEAFLLWLGDEIAAKPIPAPLPPRAGIQAVGNRK